jgi:uncharacterized membrane protein HdeD (DUF308 family)
LQYDLSAFGEIIMDAVHPLRDAGRRAGTFLTVEAIVLLLLGAVAIFMPLVAGIATTIFLGWLLLLGGVVGLISTFGSRGMPGFVWSLLSALLALFAGILLISSPVRGLFSVTLVLIAFFLADGLVTVLFAISHRAQLIGRWTWILTSGVVTIVLAIIILAGLPTSAAWALGIIIGVDMVMAGASLLAMGSTLRTL